MEGSKETF